MRSVRQTSWAKMAGLFVAFVHVQAVGQARLKPMLGKPRERGCDQRLRGAVQLGMNAEPKVSKGRERPSGESESLPCLFDLWWVAKRTTIAG